jgi:hypothetical protein
MPFVGQMERDPGGFEPGVSQGAREEAEIDPGFEQMGSVRMSAGMEGHTGFGETGPPCGCTEGALDAVSTHGLSGGSTLLVIPPGGRKAPEGVWGVFPEVRNRPRVSSGRGTSRSWAPLPRWTWTWRRWPSMSAP